MPQQNISPILKRLGLTPEKVKAALSNTSIRSAEATPPPTSDSAANRPKEAKKEKLKLNPKPTKKEKNKLPLTAAKLSPKLRELAFTPGENLTLTLLTPAAFSQNFKLDSEIILTRGNYPCTIVKSPSSELWLELGFQGKNYMRPLSGILSNSDRYLLEKIIPSSD